MTVVSIVQGLYQKLIPILDNHHSGSLTYQPCWKRLNHGMKPLHTRFSVLDDDRTVQSCSNASSSQHKVAIWTCCYPEMHCIIAWWLMLSPHCEPRSINHRNCLLGAINRCHQNCNYVVTNIFWIIEATEILIMIDVVCNVSKSLEIRSNVIL